MPEQRKTPKYAEMQWQHDQDVKRWAAQQMARDARAVAEALIQKVVVP